MACGEEFIVKQEKSRLCQNASPQSSGFRRKNVQIRNKMGIIDTLLNSRNDPGVIDFRQKKVAASNLLADYKNNSFFRKITKLPPIGLREYTIDFWPLDLGTIPNSEDECWDVVLKYTR